MTSNGWGAVDKLSLTGGTVTGTVTMQGSPPFTLVQGGWVGTVTLTGTTPVSVAATGVTSASYVFLTPQPGGSGTAGNVSAASITPGTGFTVVSTSSSDARVLAWMIVNHA